MLYQIALDPYGTWRIFLIITYRDISNSNDSALFIAVDTRCTFLLHLRFYILYRSFKIEYKVVDISMLQFFLLLIFDELAPPATVIRAELMCL